MATFKSDQFPTDGSNAPIRAHGESKTLQCLHAVTALTTAATTNDVINVGYLPPNAVVVRVATKAQSQLDSGTTLTLSLGITGTAALFQSALTTVGRAAGASVDETNAAAGVLYKNTTGAKVLVIGTVANVAATPVAGNLEHNLMYYVEE